ncbi:MAG: VCBS repeat-containing protein [Pyrinomonadaceae bacterium]
MPRDYDGDNRADFAVVRRTPPANSATSRGTLTWFILQSSTNTLRSVQFGFDVDTPAPGDYDGDGRFDIAIFRNEADGTGTFFILQSSNNSVRAVRFGLGTDLVIPGDYDGDGRTDIAVVRQGDPFRFFILRSSDNSFLELNLVKSHKFLRRVIMMETVAPTLPFLIRAMVSSTFYKVRLVPSDQQQFGQNGDIPLARSNTF